MDFDAKYFDHPDFSSDEKRQELLAFRINESDYSEKHLVKSKFIYAEGIKGLPVLKEESLIKAFKKFNLYRKLTSEGLDHRNDVVEWRELIIMHNLGIIPYALRKLPECDELFSIGYMALHRAVDYFDVSRGFAFVTYATRSILLKCVEELNKDISKRINAYPDEPLCDRFSKECSDYENREQIMALLDRYTTEVEKDIIIRNFGLNGVKPQSSRVLGRHYKVSPARILQIKERGFRKIRLGLASRPLEIECILSS